MKTIQLRGVFTALVTPFRRDGAIDRDAFARLVERQLGAGVAGLVPCGTTGETPALAGQIDHEFPGQVSGFTGAEVDGKAGGAGARGAGPYYMFS